MDNEELEAAMGESINFDNVLTIITVLLLLRTIFMIPLVNMDKVRMEMVTKDGFWTALGNWLTDKKPSPLQGQYSAALDAENASLVITEVAEEKKRYIEYIAPNGDVHVVLHHLDSGKYVSMVIQDAGGVILYRSGNFKWSARDREWFMDGNEILHAGEGPAVEMLKSFKLWTKKNRGF